MAASTTRDMDSTAVFDHLRPAGETPSAPGLPPGVYRVVGTPDAAVTLLRVADADGRRVHTGEVHTVDRADLAAFEPAENPDENRPVTARLRSQLQGFAWHLRLIGRAVLARPVPGTVALALVAAGLFGDPYLPIPDSFDLLLLLAGLGLLLSLTRTGSDR